MGHFLGQLVLVLTLALIGVVLASVFTRDRGTNWWNRCSQYRPLVLVVMASLSIGLGVFGFLGALNWSVNPVGAFTVALYQSVQHIFLNAPASVSDNLLIELSRLFGIATVVLVAYEALTRLFADSIQRLMLRRKHGHIVICGLGRIGIGLVQDLREPTLPRNAGKARLPTVVVIERDRHHAHLEKARELGAIIVHGDATDQDLLLRVRADRAESVFFVTGADESNIEGAYDLITLLGQRQGDDAKRYPPKILVHLVQPELGSVLENAAESARGEGTAHQPIDVVSFNGLLQTALNLVSEQLLPFRPTAPDLVAHYVVVGFGHIGQTVALKLAELSHFENLRRARMTVVYGPEDRHSVERFRSIYPRLMPRDGDAWSPDPAKDDWCFGVQASGTPPAPTHGIDFVVNGGFIEDVAAPESDEFVARVAMLAQRGNVKPFVFICREHEETNCTLAQELRAELDGRLKQRADAPDSPRVYRPGVQPVTVFAYVPRRPMLSRLTASEDLIAFGACRDVCSYDALTWPLQRPLAETIAQYYHANAHERRVAAAQSAGVAIPPATPAPAFARLSSWERASNLSAAAHANVKLATLGLKVVHARHAESSVAPSEISSDQRTLVARMEHNRWVAERLLGGWSFGPASDALKQRPALVDWDHLPQDEGGKDHDQVEQILRYCATGKPFVLQSLKA